MSAIMSTIAIREPGSSHPSLADGPSGFDRTWFMGKWGVAWSTLPMWKDKKDVTITYKPVAVESKINTTLDDLVEYRKRSAADGSAPSTGEEQLSLFPMSIKLTLRTLLVKGVDTLSTGANGATFDWKGSSYLFFMHSHWEVLGFGTDEGNGLEWAVTFFSKTLFTPAGIDIYLRRSSTSSVADAEEGNAVRSNLLGRIVAAVKASADKGVAKMAGEGFEVPGIV